MSTARPPESHRNPGDDGHSSPGSGGSTRERSTTAELESALDHLRPRRPTTGTLTLVVRRPERLAREILDEAVIDEADGLVGDNWLSAGHLAREGRRAVTSTRRSR